VLGLAELDGALDQAAGVEDEHVVVQHRGADEERPAEPLGELDG
jgi:hypothetical protein